MWNTKYDRPDYFYGTDPCGWLRMNQYRFPASGQALAIADGEGRNGVYLAECGFTTTSLDQSIVGQTKARELAKSRGVSLKLVQADLNEFDWPEAHYQFIAAIYAHLPQPLRAKTHQACVRALESGGLFALEAFHPRQMGYQSGGPKSEALLYPADEIASELEGLEILECFEGVTVLSEGPGHVGPAHVTRILAKKP